MRYVIKIDGRVTEYFGATKRPAYYRENGWTAYEGHLPLERLDIVDGAVVELPPPPPLPRTFSKLAILEALEAFGCREVFEAAIAASPHAWRWHAANEIREDYEGVAELIGQLAERLTAQGFDLEELLDRCADV